MKKRETVVIEAPSDLGAGCCGACLGPSAVRAAAQKLTDSAFLELPIYGCVQPPTTQLNSQKLPKNLKNFEEIAAYYSKLSEKVKECLQNEKTPLILTGDHSNAAAALLGIKKAMPDKKIGVVWIDAHGDLHSPYTSPSGNLHGMPLALALGYDYVAEPANVLSPEETAAWQSLRQTFGDQQVLAFQNLAFIGLRSLEPAEWAVVREKNILYFSVPELNRLGTEAVFQQIQNHLAGVDALYVSFDIDSLDALLVPGTGTPEPDGLSVEQAKQLLSAFWLADNLIGMEITEVNPLLDRANQTAEIAATLIETFLNA